MLEMWNKIGNLVIVHKGFGKWLGIQLFENPTTKKESRYYLFGQRDWSVVLALTENNEVLVVRQFKQGCDCILDELPAGLVDADDQNPVETMKRELREETGYEAEHIVNLGSAWMSTRNSPTQFHMFLATGCKKVSEPKPDEGEIIEHRLVPLHVWLQMIQNQIAEPSAVVTTIRSLPHLGVEL